MIEDLYTLPEQSDLPYAFTRIDAVYIWTQGGYQVARSLDDYPLFIAVLDADLEAWYAFFATHDIPVALERQPRDAVDGPYQFVLEPGSALDRTTVEGYPVIPLDETVEYIEEHSVHFGSVLSMLEEMYDDFSV